MCEHTDPQPQQSGEGEDPEDPMKTPRGRAQGRGLHSDSGSQGDGRGALAAFRSTCSRADASSPGLLQDELTRSFLPSTELKLRRNWPLAEVRQLLGGGGGTRTQAAWTLGPSGKDPAEIPNSMAPRGGAFQARHAFCGRPLGARKGSSIRPAEHAPSLCWQSARPGVALIHTTPHPMTETKGSEQSRPVGEGLRHSQSSRHGSHATAVRL